MPARPNLLFLLSDEHSFRFLSARPPQDGGEPCRTPTLDGLIERGTHFATAYCQMPLCSPSRIAMLCGRHPHRCGAWGNGSILAPDLPTFAGHLGDAGYATCAVGKMHLGGSRQRAGFQHRPYGDFGGPCSHQFDPLRSDRAGTRLPGLEMRSRTLEAGVTEVPESQLQENAVTRESLAWLREHRHASPDQPWLLLASFSRPHFPLTAPRRHFERYWPVGVTAPRVGRSGDSADHPLTVGAVRGFRTEEIEPQEGLRARAAYFACVDFLDELLGDFLALLERDGLLDDTVILYTSDHGELAGEHGLWWKHTWHEAATRVPFVVSTPEHRRGQVPRRQVDDPVSLADLFPTLCGLAGVVPVPGLDGVDLSPALRGDDCPALDDRAGVITESLQPRWGAGTEFRMIRSRRHKYVAFRDGPDLAFDLEADPDEQKNALLPADRTKEGDPVLDRLRRALLDGFDFAGVADLHRRQVADLGRRFPARVECATPNQVLRGDGTLVEADTPLYEPRVVSADPAADFAP